MTLQSDALAAQQQRTAACIGLLEEAGRRDLTAEVKFGNTTRTINFNETTLDDLINFGETNVSPDFQSLQALKTG